MIQITLLKPFNPVIGETFQADINGGVYSAEQVSHHPPVSAFHYRKDNYQIYAAIELSASIGLNSG
jgi:oxysterol-binding protein-related protein 1/2